MNPTHGHLQVRSRPKTDCSFLKPTEHECVVEVDEMHEPFKIGIRAFQLHDSGVGSLALITDIQYEAQVCRENGKLIFIFLHFFILTYIQKFPRFLEEYRYQHLNPR